MSDESNAERVAELASEFLQRCRAGERPSLNDYIRQHPELESQIREVFPMMLLMEDVAVEPATKPTSDTLETLTQLGDFRIHRIIGRGGMGVVYEATQESLGRRVALKVCPLGLGVSDRQRARFRRESRSAAMLHHTNIVPVFAVGEEDGLLYYAMQFISGATLESVIHELRFLTHSTPTAGTRFGNHLTPSEVGKTVSQETNPPSGQATRVAQTLIGRESEILESSESSDVTPPPLETAEQSDSLQTEGSSDAARQRHNDKYWRSVARIGMQAAEALAYAHDKGTLHRDIKPGNLMLDEAGTIWVLDFGLAKSMEEDDLTRAGELVGTLRYMSPEQCRGNPSTASDVYSLGLTLYELLTLRPAYEEVHRSELLRAIGEKDPTRPRKINSYIPRDLETIVMKAIKRTPSRRYAGAAELSADLKRFLAGEPIAARAISPSERFLKWVRRRPAVATLAGSLALLLVTSFLLVSWKWRDAVRQERYAKSQEALAESRLAQTREALYRSAISQADVVSRNDPQLAAKVLEDIIPQRDQVDYRGWEWGYLNERVSQSILTLQAGASQSEWIRSLAFSPDETWLAVGACRTGFTLPRNQSPRGRATLWDLQTGELITELPVQHSPVSLAISSDKKRVAICDAYADSYNGRLWPGTTKIWDIETGQPIAQLDDQPAELEEYSEQRRINSLQFFDGDRSVVGTIWSTAYTPIATAVWDTTTGKIRWIRVAAELASVEPDEDHFLIAQFPTPMTSSKFSTMIRIDCETFKATPTGGKLSRAFLTPTKYFGISCNSGGSSQTLSADNVATGNRVRMPGNDDYRVNSNSHVRPIAAVNPAGTALAAGATDGTIRLWEPREGRLQRILRGHAIDVQSIAYSPTGRYLASGDWNGEVRVWEPDFNAEKVTCVPRTTNVNRCLIEAIAFRFDGSNLVAFSDVMDYGRYRSTAGLMTTWDSESGLRLGDRLAIASANRMQHRQARFDGSGSLLAMIDHNGNVTVTDSESGKQRFSFRDESADPRELSISRDGRRLAATFANDEAKVWDLQTNKIIANLPGPVRKPTLDSSGNLLAAGFQDTGSLRHRVKVHDLLTGKSHFIASPPFGTEPGKRISAISFSNDNLRLAICGEDGRMGIYDAVTGKAVTGERSVPAGIEDIAWHPSDTRLAGANREVVLLWDSGGNEIMKLLSKQRTGDMPFDPTVIFSPDGSKLAASQWDNSVNVWTSERPYNEPATVTPRSTLRRSRSMYALHTIDETVKAVPDNPWYRLARGQLGSRERSGEQTLTDYQTAKKQLASDDPCLLLHGKAFVQAPSLPLHQLGEFTMEAWVKQWNYMQTGQTYGVVASQYPKQPEELFARIRHAGRADLDRYGWFWLRPTEAYRDVRTRWAHLAVTNSELGRRYFLDGAYIGKNQYRTFNPEMSDFYIGDTDLHHPSVKGRGLIRSIRVSEGALYDPDIPFEPPTDFKANAKTVLLFDFRIDDGVSGETPTQILDRSGNDRHGTLREAWWLDAD